MSFLTVSSRLGEFPKASQMIFAGQALRSNKFAILSVADNRNIVFGPRGVPKKAGLTRYLAFLNLACRGSKSRCLLKMGHAFTSCCELHPQEWPMHCLSNWCWCPRAVLNVHFGGWRWNSDRMGDVAGDHLRVCCIPYHSQRRPDPCTGIFHGNNARSL
jgi:hypothetical protein